VKTPMKFKRQKVTCLQCWKKARHIAYLDYECPHCGFSWDFVDHNGVVRMHYRRGVPKRIKSLPFQPVNPVWYHPQIVPDGLLAVFEDMILPKDPLQGILRVRQEQPL